MATADSHITVTFDSQSLADTRREVRRILADARKASQELAKLQAQCEALGIRFEVKETSHE